MRRKWACWPCMGCAASIMALILIAIVALLSGCKSDSANIPSPAPGQWVCSACSGMGLGSDGSFSFPSSGGAVGYIYTGYNGDAYGKTITLTYTVSGTGTVLPSAASGTGNAEVRLFVWRRGDDLQCTATTEWYRQWATWGTPGAGPLTVGTHTISMVISDPGWTDCLGKSDDGQLRAVATNLVGVGFTFGAAAFGHGVFSTGNNTFTVDSFTVQ